MNNIKNEDYGNSTNNMIHGSQAYRSDSQRSPYNENVISSLRFII